MKIGDIVLIFRNNIGNEMIGCGTVYKCGDYTAHVAAYDLYGNFYPETFFILSRLEVVGG